MDGPSKYKKASSPIHICEVIKHVVTQLHIKTGLEWYNPQPEIACPRQNQVDQRGFSSHTDLDSRLENRAVNKIGKKIDECISKRLI